MTPALAWEIPPTPAPIDFRDFQAQRGSNGDNTAAFNLAAQQLGGIQDAELYIPPGDWYFGATAFGQSGLKVRGVYGKTKLIAQTGRAGGAILNFSGCNDFHVSELFFDGNFQSIAFNFLSTSGSRNILERCISKGNPFSDQAFKLHGQNDSEITRNLIMQADRDGIDIGGAGVLAGWNRFVADADAPVGFNAGDDCISCFGGVLGGTIIGNVFDNPNHARGGHISVGAPAGLVTGDLAIIGNVSKYAYRAFVRINSQGPTNTGNVDGVTIAGNVGELVGWNNNTANFGDFISIEALVANCKISRIKAIGNVFRYCHRHGFWINSTQATALVEDIWIDDTYFNDNAVLNSTGVPIQAGAGVGISCLNPVGTVNGVRTRGSYRNYPIAGVNVAGANVVDFINNADTRV